MGDSETPQGSWWRTLPGLLTAIAGILTAFTGLIVGLHQAGLLHSGGGHPTTDQAVAEEHASASSRPTTALKPEPANLPASAPGPNLLAVDQGGKLVAVPSDTWSAANDGDLTNSESVSSRTGAVFGFKDDQPATFNRFGYLVLESYYTPESIEIAAADTLSGPFRTVSTVKLQDQKVITTGGWQYFELPPTTARYVKITLGYAFGGAQAGNLTELGLYEAS